MTPQPLDNRAAKMLENPIGDAYVKYPVKVSGKILKQLGSGIYRTPANVVKELVSNSFDADAPSVTIEMDYPNFLKFSCYDAGTGLSAAEFAVKMQEIGGSAKGFSGGETPKGRPMIGRIGIGLLAIGQISPQFRFVSGKRNDKEGFEAIVNLERFFAPGPESYRPLEELALGTVSLRKYEKDPADHFTLVSIPNVDAVFRERMQIPEDWRRGAHFWGFQGKEKQPFGEFLDWVSEFSGIKKLAGYDQFLWELALLCPIPYVENGPVMSSQLGVIRDLRRQLEKFNFSVVVDGIELRKPIAFPNDRRISRPDEDYKVYELRIEGKVGDRSVKATGYYYHQLKRIAPAELRGILPRIRNVGIGLHSNNLFRILQENPIAAFQLSGELYVDEGLDEALNIDRNSFFESDPAFTFIREGIDKCLRDRNGILNDIRKRQARARKRGRREGDEEFIAFVVTLAQTSGLRNPRLTFSDERQLAPVRVDESGEITVFDSPILPRGKYSWQLAILYHVCFELSAQGSPSESKRREKFCQLARLIAEW